MDFYIVATYNFKLWSDRAEVSVLLEYAGIKDEGQRRRCMCVRARAWTERQSLLLRNDALCMTLTWDWSISHCNEVAHRLHQWQSIYRLNLYNERNLFLSATCFAFCQAWSKDSRGVEGVGGVGKIRYAHVCGGGKKTKTKLIIIIVIKTTGSGGREESSSCDTWACVCVTAVGKIVVRGLGGGGGGITIIRMQWRGHQWLMCVMGNSGRCSLFSIYSVSSSSLPSQSFLSMNSFFFCSLLTSICWGYSFLSLPFLSCSSDRWFSR